ncbi:MAG: site-2 protease family protein [Candidatus Sumerlaeaceae bacterium]|nr:site-2 protease family protein [Candidatus Sumerlaeaceae bacterium]
MSLFRRATARRAGATNAAALVAVAVALALSYILLHTFQIGPQTSRDALWALLVAAAVLLWLFLAHRKRAAAARGIHSAPAVVESAPEPDEVIRLVLEVEDSCWRGSAAVFTGRLRGPSQSVYQCLSDHYDRVGLMPMLQPASQGRVSVIVAPKLREPVPSRRGILVNIGLFLLTLLTTTYAGARLEGVDLLKNPERFAAGLPYSLGLLGILGFHEMGHYIAARLHGMSVTPPYFIPVPFALGTFGAFIQMRSPSEQRRSLFDVAVAGPLAGLVVAIPALVMGYQQSRIVPWLPQFLIDALADTLPIQSYLMHLVGVLTLGPKIKDAALIDLSPLAFAGYLGLLVTALNLLPIGQLDGGHIARAMFGQRTGTWISHAALAALFGAALTVAPALMPWAVIVTVLGTARPIPPMDDVTPIGPGRKLLGWLAFVILALILWPAPA